MTNLISVIVPVYNVEKYIDKCLSSIIEQTYGDIEIIIINDGSTDKSYEICKKYKLRDSRIKLFSQNNKGVSAARNVGLAKAYGDFILFVDADDYLEKNLILKLYNNINEVDISICNYNKIENNMVQFHNSTLKSGLLDKNEFLKYMLAFDEYGGYMWNKLIRRNSIGKIRFIENISIMEDLIFLINISDNIKAVYYESNEYLYNYVMRDTSAMNSLQPNIFESFECLLDVLPNQDMIAKCKYDYIYTSMDIYYRAYKNFKLTDELKKQIKEIYLFNFKDVMKSLKINNYMKLKLKFITMFPLMFFSIKKILKNR